MVQAVNVAMVVAIDGPSGSGKSTVARGVATALGFGYLDTGAMYRAITWLVLDSGLPTGQVAADPTRLGALLEGASLVVGTTPVARLVQVAGQDVTDAIRGPEVTSAVSAVAALPAVRAFLSRRQRELAAAMIADSGGAVIEGRDIGTVIFPDARLKVWLTASPEARGRRRAVEQSDGSAPAAAAVEGTVEQLARRDGLDSSRTISPLQRADDAHAIDTTPYTAQEVIDLVLGLWNTVELPDATSLPSAHDDHAHHSPTGAAR
ncbi:(d)CMP kinase [Acidothermaceae bacterium B102]|nr:(d)CMP kinase [Acidothermaceae bacterium B102]